MKVSPHSKSDFIEVARLTKDGSVTPEGEEQLYGEGLLDEAFAKRTVENALSTIPKGHEFELPASELHRVRQRLLLEHDHVEVLNDFLRRSETPLDFYRIGFTNLFYSRTAFWRIVSSPSDASWNEIRDAGSVPSGRVEFGGAQPSLFVLGPLIARNQPQAAAFITTRYATVVAVPVRGQFYRPVSLGSGWPTGVNMNQLGGRGAGIYRSDITSLPEGHSAANLENCVGAANALLAQTLDPSQWITDERGLDTLSFELAWANLQLGFNAIAELGVLWGPDSNVWVGFRALTVLEGLWNDLGSPVTRRDLLRPKTIRSLVLLPALGETELNWTADLIDNWESMLAKLRTGDEEAIASVDQLRNLVHGIAATRSARENRLRALDLLRSSDFSALMVADLARMWWTAVLFDPLRLAPPNYPSEIDL